MPYGVGFQDFPEILPYDTISILVLESQHATAGMLDEYDLGSTKELL
jgi:hypothetical protein